MPDETKFQPTQQQIDMIPFKLLMTSSLNPRVVDPGPEKLASLAASIEAEGLLENIVVRPSPIQAGHFELVAGHTRCRAFQLLVEQGKRSDGDPLPARVKDPCSDLELVTLAMVENVQRNDLHPLDEAEGFARLREMGLTPEQIAKSLPYTTRLVQLRLQLADNLTEETKKAFRQGAFNLQSARILAASCPPARQAAVVERIQAGDWKYATPDRLQDTLRSEAIPLANALFKRELYTGLVQVDAPELDEEDSGWEVEEDTELAADLEEFWRLQDEAIEARKLELERDHAEVRVIRGQGWWHPGHEGLREGCKDKTKAVAVLLVESDGEVTEFTRLGKPGDAPVGGKKKKKDAIGGKTPAELAAESGENTLPSKAGQIMAKHAKTRALRAAMLEGGTKPAMVAAIVALMGRREVVHLGYDEGYGPQADHIAAPEVEKVLAKYRLRLKPYLSTEKWKISDTPGGPRRLAAREAKVDDLVAELMGWTPDDVGALFTALVAAAIGSYPGHEPKLGDDYAAVAFADYLRPDVAAVWQLDEPYARTLKKAGLVRALDDMGIDVEAEGLAGKKVGELADSAVHVAKAVTQSPAGPYLPPLFHFGSEADVRRRIKPGAAVETPNAIPESKKLKTQAQKAAASAGAKGGLDVKKAPAKKAATKPATKKTAKAKPPKKGSRRATLAKKEKTA